MPFLSWKEKISLWSINMNPCVTCVTHQAIWFTSPHLHKNIDDVEILTFEIKEKIFVGIDRLTFDIVHDNMYLLIKADIRHTKVPYLCAVMTISSKRLGSVLEIDTLYLQFILVLLSITLSKSLHNIWMNLPIIIIKALSTTKESKQDCIYVFYRGSRFGHIWMKKTKQRRGV